MAQTVAELQVVVSADMSGVEASLKEASNQVSSFGSSFKEGLGIGVGITAVTGAIQAIGSAFGALKGSVIDFNQQLDQSRAVFTRYFEGNQATAEAFLTTLKGFAATTPFEFKDLSQFAIRLQNANTNANDIIPTLKAIGNAASATGTLSTTEVDRITLALTQMQMKGKVSGEEMLQLTEANVPAWNILAEATGKPVAQLQKMASEGEITADTFIKAFRGMYENAGLMEGASKTLEGALSTVRDVGTQAFADIGRSVYDLATAGANQLAKFMSSADFQAWVSAATIAMNVLVDGIKGVISALQPLGETIATVFGQLTSGDFAGAFGTIANTVQSVMTDISTAFTSIVGSMFGAGANMVTELANGMISAAGDVLQTAVNVVADTIAAFLIGQSPPPKGPLADVDKGGAAVMEAWGQGAKDAAEGAIKPAVDGVKAQIDSLKESGRAVGDEIRDVGQAIQEIERTSRDLKYTAEDVKKSYDDQIKALDEQIKSASSIADVERDREKLNLSLEEIQLRQAEIAAQGDPIERARLQTQLDRLKADETERKNKEAIADAEKDIHGTEKERLKTQLDAQKMAQEERDLRAKLKTAKPEDRQRIQEQLSELETRKQIAAADAKERQDAAARRAEEAKNRKDQLDVQGQINGLVDKEALASIKQQEQVIKDKQTALGLDEQAARLQAEIAAGPLKAERARLVAEREAALKPLQDQLDALGKQKAALSDQRQELQNIKAELAANTAELQAQVKAITDAGKAQKEAALNAPTPKVDKTFTPDAVAQKMVDDAKAAGAKLATAISSGFSDTISSLVPSLVTDWFTDMAKTIQTDGIPGVLGVIGGGLEAAVPVFTHGLAVWTSKLLDWIDSAVRALLPAMSSLIDGIVNWIQDNARPIGSTLADWTLEFINWARTNGLALLSQLASTGGQMLSWIGQTATMLAGKLYDWAIAFVGWVGPLIPDLLTELGLLAASVVEWIGIHLGDLLDALGAWAVAFVEWVGPKIPDLLAALGDLLVNVVDWAAHTALPAIVDKLADWAVAIVEWVAPRIVPLLTELGKLLAAISKWFIETALPAIILQLAKWSFEFINWIVPVLRDLPDALFKIGEAIGTWIADRVKDGSAQSFTDLLKGWVDAFVNWPMQAGLGVGKVLGEHLGKAIVDWVNYQLDPSHADGIVGGAVKLGTGMLDGIQKGLSDNWGQLSDWITENIGKKLPEWMRNLLGINSPSTVFAGIGENIILGLIAGMERRKGELLDKAKGLLSFGDVGSGGDLDDWLKAAISIAGVGSDWLHGLRWIAEHESSGNPRARNPEGVDGQHASGLMQMMPSTFRGHRNKDLPDDIYNPIANAVAAIGYIQDRYISNGRSLEWIISHWAERGGYAQGGWAGLHGPELALLGERGPEYVVPNHALRNAAAAPVQTHRVELTIGGQAAAEIYVTGRETAIRYGRRAGGAA